MKITVAFVATSIMTSPVVHAAPLPTRLPALLAPSGGIDVLPVKLADPLLNRRSDGEDNLVVSNAALSDESSDKMPQIDQHYGFLEARKVLDVNSAKALRDMGNEVAFEAGLLRGQPVRGAGLSAKPALMRSDSQGSLKLGDELRGLTLRPGVGNEFQVLHKKVLAADLEALSEESHPLFQKVSDAQVHANGLPWYKFYKRRGAKQAIVEAERQWLPGQYETNAASRRFYKAQQVQAERNKLLASG